MRISESPFARNIRINLHANRSRQQNQALSGTAKLGALQVACVVVHGHATGESEAEAAATN